MFARGIFALIGVASCAVSMGQSASNWSVSSHGPMAVRGTLNAVSNTQGLVMTGDQFSGISVMDFVADSGVTLTFSGFGNPTAGNSSPFDMNLQFEISGLGVVFQGQAKSLNFAAVDIPAPAAKAGVSMILRRTVRANKNARVGSYVNVGVISVSKI